MNRSDGHHICMIAEGSLLSPRPRHHPSQRLHPDTKHKPHHDCKTAPNNDIQSYFSRHGKRSVWMRYHRKRKILAGQCSMPLGPAAEMEDVSWKQSGWHANAQAPSIHAHATNVASMLEWGKRNCGRIRDILEHHRVRWKFQVLVSR